MIKRCDHPGCGKAGIIRAPKNRHLTEFWMFCRTHAAEYNKNWNYYANMTPAEIEADWERQMFGDTINRAGSSPNPHQVKFINDFVLGRDTSGDQYPVSRPLPTGVVTALKTLNLPLTATLGEIGNRYRTLAKKYHPDIATEHHDATEFTKISDAYDVLRRHFSSKK